MIYVYALLIFLLTPLQVFSAPGDTYWVDDNGTQTTWKNCKSASPMSGMSACTWQTAMSNASAGETVYFRQGTYDPGRPASYSTPGMAPANSGSADNEIIFACYTGETCIIKDYDLDGNSQPGAAAFGALEH